MNIIPASYQILTPLDGMDILKYIERIGRVCYKSEDKITDDSCTRFVKMLIDRGHEAMLEHYSLSVLFICDRGVSHEIVRHRLASFAQESTRYCNYSQDKFGNELTFVKPIFYETGNPDGAIWETTCRKIEGMYFGLLKQGSSPQEARSILPNSLKTEVVMTANLREWRHFFKLRTADTAHLQMRELTRPLCTELKRLIPVVFDDIVWEG